MVCSTQVPPLINLDSGGIITRKIIGKHMQPLVFDHFSSNVYNGFLKDCTITFDKSDGSDPTGREEYWKRVLKTVNPHGLNTID